MVEGVLVADQENFDKAAEVNARTADALARTLGPIHPDTLRCKANWLQVRRDLGEDTAVELHRVLDQLELTLGTGHPTIATLRENRRLLRALDPQPF
jgi:hypothetical protein